MLNLSKSYIAVIQYTELNSEMCVSWDFDLQEWTTRGCNVAITDGGNTAICQCNHLTNFAVLAVTIVN